MTMRTLPILLCALAGGVGLVIGVRVFGGAAVAPAAPPTVRLLGGVPQGGIYTGVSEEPGDVNPFTVQAQAARRLVLGNTHEALLDVDPRTGDLRPAVAESFELSADRRQCTFTLRAGICFADGRPVTLDDVLFGWQLAQAGHLRLGSIADAFARVSQVETIDERRFRIGFRDAHYASLRIVGTRWLVAQKQFFVDRVAARSSPAPAPDPGSEAFARLLAQVERECGPGTGPYRFDNPAEGPSGWRPHNDLELTRNEHCWQRQARPGTWNFDGIRLLFRDPAAATNALLLGQLDWFSSAATRELLRAQPELQQDYVPHTYDYDALGVYRVVWHCARGPTADVRVRTALGMLFDVEAWRRGCEGIGPRALAHCKPDSAALPQVTALPFDPAAARRQLRDAGFAPEADRPLRLVVLALQGTDALRRIADLFADAASQAGIELELRRRDLKGFMQDKATVEWHGLLTLQAFRPWGDPWDFLHSRGLDNEGQWVNAEADRLADAAQVEPQAAQRDAIWRELHTLVHREQPVALLAHPLVSMLLHRRIEGASIGPGGLVLDRAFVAAADQRR